MKANELMIGDWVQNTCGHKGKVIGFRYDITDKDNEIVIAYHSNNTTWSQATLIEPIPLTKEILKANGFEFNCSGYDIFTNENIMFRIVLSNKGFLLSNNFYCDIFIHYVHELQHALRICALNKLADNFKIE